MSQQTSYAGLMTYDVINTDKNLRTKDVLGADLGTNPESNLNKIDRYLSLHNSRITSLESEFGEIRNIATVKFEWQSTVSTTDYYIATSTEITSYVNDSIYLFYFNKTNVGNVTFKINQLDTFSLKKLSLDGNLIDMEINDIKIGIPYLVHYIDSQIVFVGENYTQELSKKTDIGIDGKLKDEQVPFANKVNITSIEGLASSDVQAALAELQLKKSAGDESGNANNALKLGGQLPAWYIQSNPNLLVNAHFPIWQRGETIQPKDVAYTADRWEVGFSTLNLATISKNPTGGLLATWRATGYMDIRQKIDLSEKSMLIGKPITISASIDGIIYSGTVTLTSNKDYVRINRASNNEVQVNTLGAETTILAEITSAYGAAGTNMVVNWAKLELGDHATPFVPRLYGEELVLCQRYYYNPEPSSDALHMCHYAQGGFLRVPIPLPVSIRTQCTIIPSAKGHIEIFANNQWQVLGDLAGVSYYGNNSYVELFYRILDTMVGIELGMSYICRNLPALDAEL